MCVINAAYKMVTLLLERENLKGNFYTSTDRLSDNWHAEAKKSQEIKNRKNVNGKQN